MTAADRVAAVIVNYNAGPHLTAAVRSVRSEGVGTIVVVDNGSTDGSTASLLDADPEVHVVDPGGNVGFGTGVNRGAVVTDKSLLLIMNPDAALCPGAVAALVAALDADPELGIVGGRIEEPDGSLYPSARAFPSLGDAVGHAFLGLLVTDNRFTRRYRMLDDDPTRPRRVDWVSGACMLARRECFDAIGGFDERYFMFGEDVDLCWRAWQAGWATAYEPTARVTHVQGVSTDHMPYRMVASHHRSLMRFWWKTTPLGRRLLLAPFVAVGLTLRTVLMWARRGLSSARPK